MHEEHHEAYMKESRLLAKSAWMSGRIYDTGQGYPACVPAEKGTVYGELYEVAADALNKIDVLEEGYDKQEINVMTDQGQVEAMTYTLPEQKTSALKEIKRGCWKAYRLWRQRSRHPSIILPMAPVWMMQDLSWQKSIITSNKSSAEEY
nr:gamma-glutamylcyclotransferase [Bacillus pumilus]